MKLRIIAVVVLLAVLAGAIWEASVLRREYHSARELHESHADQLSAVENQAAKLQQELDALTMDEALRQHAEADRLLQEAQELSSQMEQLRIEIESMTELFGDSLEHEHGLIDNFRSDAVTRQQYDVGVHITFPPSAFSRTAPDRPPR